MEKKPPGRASPPRPGWQVFTDRVEVVTRESNLRVQLAFTLLALLVQ